VYVDNIIIIESNEENIREIKRQLKDKFNIKNLGYLKYFLGTEITYSNGGVISFTKKICVRPIKKTNKRGCKLVYTIINSKYKLNSKNGEPLEDIN
jgi:CRISPR/Cas system CMR-associated protein Cmr3 (group 5 of RAMP superfamily)